MKLPELTRIPAKGGGLDTTSQVVASGEEESFSPHADVAILDEDVLDDDYFEPEGMNDFIRDHGSWDPDREC